MEIVKSLIFIVLFAGYIAVSYKANNKTKRPF